MLGKQTNPAQFLTKQFYDEIKKSVKVSFNKVKGHSGDKYNDVADKTSQKTLWELNRFFAFILTKSCFGYIMIIEKGKTLNGYAISVLFMKNNADLWLSGRYFFMEITKSNRTIIKTRVFFKFCVNTK